MVGAEIVTPGWSGATAVGAEALLEWGRTASAPIVTKTAISTAANIRARIGRGKEGGGSKPFLNRREFADTSEGRCTPRMGQRGGSFPRRAGQERSSGG